MKPARGESSVARPSAAAAIVAWSIVVGVGVALEKPWHTGPSSAMATYALGPLFAAYALAAHFVSGRRGRAPWVPAMAGLLFPVWVIAWMVMLSMVGFALGQHDEPLPGDPRFGAPYAAIRVALAATFVTGIAGVFGLTSWVFTRSAGIGVGIAACFAGGLAASSITEMWSRVIIHSAPAGLLLGWAVYGRRTDEARLARWGIVIEANARGCLKLDISDLCGEE